MDAEKLFKKLTEELRASKNGKDILKGAEQSVLICEKYILQLKQSLKNQPFTSQKEEIHFFKNVKPRFMSKLIYYVQLFNLEYRRPKQQDLEKKYLLKQLRRVNDFIDDNIEFYRYYKTGATHLDNMN